MEKGPKRRNRTERETKKNARERSLPSSHLEKCPNARVPLGTISAGPVMVYYPWLSRSLACRLYLFDFTSYWGGNFPLSREHERARVLGRRVSPANSSYRGSEPTSEYQDRGIQKSQTEQNQFDRC